MTLLDAYFGAFVQFLRRRRLLDSTLLLVCSCRGYPLGTHGVIGAPGEAGAWPLHSELVHVPCLARFPAASQLSARSQALVQPGDLAATLAAWWEVHDETGFGKDLNPEAVSRLPPWRDRAVVVSGAARRPHAGLVPVAS